MNILEAEQKKPRQEMIYCASLPGLEQEKYLGGLLPAS